MTVYGKPLATHTESEIMTQRDPRSYRGYGYGEDWQARGRKMAELEYEWQQEVRLERQAEVGNRPATEKQVAYWLLLVARHDWSGVPEAVLESMQNNLAKIEDGKVKQGEKIRNAFISANIERLKALPLKGGIAQPQPAVESGTQGNTEPASDKQLRFIRGLLKERVVDASLRAEAEQPNISKKTASALIGKLTQMPKCRIDLT